MEEKSNVVYIYNADQADYYIAKGCNILGTGKHRTTKNVFFKFDYNETLIPYQEWCEICREFKANKNK